MDEAKNKKSKCNYQQQEELNEIKHMIQFYKVNKPFSALEVAQST
jgi:hypothetical protein